MDDHTKFEPVSTGRPVTRRQSPKYYHPLLQKEKELTEITQEFSQKVPQTFLSPNGSRLAHLYGLPNTHKKDLAMRPILSATGTYNYPLAKWLDEKLKVLSVNEHAINDTFKLVEKLQELTVKDSDVIISYEVCSLFTNVPLGEIFNILSDKAFKKLVRDFSVFISCPF